MRVVVTGASGNVGAGVLRALAAQMPDAEVVGICRRPPTTGEKYERVQWHAVDLSSPTAAAELEPAMRDADVVVHLALAIQPVRDADYLYRANVIGTQSLLSAMNAAGSATGVRLQPGHLRARPGSPSRRTGRTPASPPRRTAVTR